MSRPLADKIQRSALTDVGLTRSQNQDACALFTTKGDALIAVVADGMGGHAGGETASRIAVETIHELLSTSHEEIDGDSMANAIVESNQRIYSKAMNEPALRGMGTTVVALLLHPDGRTWVAHVGDSRAYRLRANAFEPLTQDHSVVAELVKMGAISEAEAEVDPRRNEILRSVGAAPSVKVDVNSVSVLPGDRLLLCSDGLTGPVGTRDISDLLGSYDPGDATRMLIARANEAGSPDNITAIALHYPNPHEVTAAQSLPLRPEATASEIDLIAAELAEERIARARGLLGLAALVGVALLLSLIAIIVTNSTSQTGELPAVRELDTRPNESTQTAPGREPRPRTSESIELDPTTR
jgi:protein phosphatase